MQKISSYFKNYQLENTLNKKIESTACHSIQIELKLPSFSTQNCSSKAIKTLMFHFSSKFYLFTNVVPYTAIEFHFFMNVAIKLDFHKIHKLNCNNEFNKMLLQSVTTATHLTLFFRLSVLLTLQHDFFFFIAFSNEFPFA